MDTSTRFKKGNTTGARGRPKGSFSYDREERIARKVSKEMVFRYLNANCLLTYSELKKRLRTDPLSALEASIIKLIISCFEKPDVRKLDFLLDRLIGKAKTVKIQSQNQFSSMSDAELLKLKIALQIENSTTLTNIEHHKINNNSN